MDVRIVEIDDIYTEDLSYNFSDGCGYMSQDVAQEIENQLKVK